MDITAYQHMNIRMSTRGKRPLRNLTPNDKVRAIQRIHNGETKASVSRDIGVPESTLRGWCKNEQKLRFMCRQLGTTDHMSLNGSDAPPEKRLKFVSSSSPLKLKANAKNLEDFGYNGLQLSATDFAKNGILEKASIDDFIQTTNLMQEPATKSSQLPSDFNQSLILAEYSQLAMLQNFNLLTLLNPNLTTAQTMSVSSQVEDCKPNIPFQVAGNAICNNNGETRSSPTLSVKNWAKDPAKESMSVDITAGRSPNESNDNNNNDPSIQLASTQLPEALFSTVFPTNPSPFKDLESSNVALMDWCKLFNASLNYLALSAAAAALQQPGAAGFGSNGDLIRKDSREGSANNILYSHLTKNSFPLPGNHLASSDVSNDSYFDSEPEDLSVPSTSSKISSPTNSRSQSPNLLSTSSVHSDFE